jgi:hypothetical protein
MSDCPTCKHPASVHSGGTGGYPCSDCSFCQHNAARKPSRLEQEEES